MVKSEEPIRAKVNVAFIGLGVMGYPMAGHLANAGYNVTVFNRTQVKAEKWSSEYGGRVVQTPAEAAINADLVFTCVGNDDDLREIALGEEGVFQAMNPGSIFVDHTTASAEIARELSMQAAKQQLKFIDAPVSGGQSGAEKGILTVMCGGGLDEFNRAKPVIEAYAQEMCLLGPVGSGQLCKMVNQICAVGVIEGLAEGIFFAQSAGLDIPKVINTISKGAAQSWQMDNRYQTMLANEYEHGFAVDLLRKDLRIVLNEASQNGVELPATEMIDNFYADIQEMGGNKWDASSLLARLQHLKKHK